ncbi:hypothetical protein M4D68_09685 [Priestia aryabhattai]|uniref:hypothetical protein n=1 Tax=Priestia aryabhattai TaxID=412384 RepID=UPI002041F9DF|nr:hypothetical protein [Priestia aryabhattai]MCM3641407.1 hypothetical protein [Priestia aryabhattai]
MMKKLTEAFKGKSELDKNNEELNVVSATIAELNEKLGKYQAMLQGAQLELEIEEDAGTKKRIKKLENGVAKITVEIEEHQKRSEELNQAIADELETQRQARIEEAKNEFEQHVYEAHKVVSLRPELERLTVQYENHSGLVKAQSLRGIAGLKHGEEFDLTNVTHQELAQASNEAGQAGRERAQKEVDEMIKQLKAFLENK